MQNDLPVVLHIFLYGRKHREDKSSSDEHKSLSAGRRLVKMKKKRGKENGDFMLHKKAQGRHELC